MAKKQCQFTLDAARRPLDRREFLFQGGTSLAGIALAALVAEERTARTAEPGRSPQAAREPHLSAIPAMWL